MPKSGQEYRRGTIGMRETWTVDCEVLLEMGEEIGTVSCQIDMIAIAPALAGPDFQFEATEVQMPMSGLVFIEIPLELHLTEVSGS